MHPSVSVLQPIHVSIHQCIHPFMHTPILLLLLLLFIAFSSSSTHSSKRVLAPLCMQDYHRFHFLAGATLASITNVPGRLYTVNPIAINSPFANVLTQNKRAICMYDTPDYGPVAFVVIGATMVSICQLTSSQHCYIVPTLLHHHNTVTSSQHCCNCCSLCKHFSVCIRTVLSLVTTAAGHCVR